MVDLRLTLIGGRSFLGAKDPNYTLFHALAENELIHLHQEHLDQESLTNMGIDFLSELADKKTHYLGMNVTPESYHQLLKLGRIYNIQKDKYAKQIVDMNTQLFLTQQQLKLLEEEKTKSDAENKRLVKCLNDSERREAFLIQQLQIKQSGVEVSTQTDISDVVSQATNTDIQEDPIQELQELYEKYDALDEKVYELTQQNKVLRARLQEMLIAQASLQDELTEERTRGSWS